MSDITSEELNELNILADEQYALERLIEYIKNPGYTVMWVSIGRYYPLSNKIEEVGDELAVDLIGTKNEYIDLYNINMEDIKIYKEVIDRHIHKQIIE